MHDLHAAAGEESIGARIRRLRLERGLSQRELSGPGVSYAYVSRIEAGQRDPSLKALRILARKLGVSLEHLETGATLSDAHERQLRLADAELELRLGDDVRAAEQSFRALLVDARENGDTFVEARARTGLGLALAQSGDLRGAVAELERVLDAEAVAPEVEPEAFATLARLYRQLGIPQRGVQLLQRCLEDLAERAPDDAASAALFASYLGEALEERGEPAGARTALLEAKERLEAVGGTRARIRFQWSLARAAVGEGRFVRALAYLRRAAALLEASEETLELARAHLSCARVLIGDGRAELGRGEEALERAREAIEILEDDEGEGGAWYALGVAHALRDEIDEADAAFRRAVDHLARGGDWREAAKASREWARALRGAGREGEAFDVMEQATLLTVRGMGAEARRAR